jgi:hypothetical protein
MNRFKKIICLLLVICFVMPLSSACVGLQGSVTVTIKYLDGTTKTVKGHRKWDDTWGEDSIFTKLSYAATPTVTKEGHDTVFYFDGGGYLDSDYLYQVDNGARLVLIEKLQIRRYTVLYTASCPELTKTQSYEIRYNYGDKMELTQEIEDLLVFENPSANFDRYTFDKWQIVYKENGKTLITRDFNFGDTFNTVYEARFEETKRKAQYYYYMEVQAVWSPDTYNVVYHFEHDGVKPLNTKVENVVEKRDFYATGFSASTFKKYVKEEDIEFIGFSTDMYSLQSLPTQMSKEYNGKDVHVYALWSRFKTVNIDFLNGKGPVPVQVYDAKNENSHYVDILPLLDNLTKEQRSKLIGFSENIHGISRILNFYEVADASKTYYPIFID